MRIVNKDMPSSCVIADAIRAVAEKAISEGAVAFLGAWETPADVNWMSAPHAETVTEGIVIRLAREILMPSLTDDD